MAGPRFLASTTSAWPLPRDPYARPWSSQGRAQNFIGPRSQPLEAPEPLPVGDRGLERRELDVGRVDVVRDDLLAEGAARHLACGEQLAGLRRVGQARLVGRQVGVALDAGSELEALLDAVQARGDQRASAR